MRRQGHALPSGERDPKPLLDSRQSNPLAHHEDHAAYDHDQFILCSAISPTASASSPRTCVRWRVTPPTRGSTRRRRTRQAGGGPVESDDFRLRRRYRERRHPATRRVPPRPRSDRHGDERAPAHAVRRRRTSTATTGRRLDEKRDERLRTAASSSSAVTSSATCRRLVFGREPFERLAKIESDGASARRVLGLHGHAQGQSRLNELWTAAAQRGRSGTRERRAWRGRRVLVTGGGSSAVAREELADGAEVVPARDASTRTSVARSATA